MDNWINKSDTSSERGSDFDKRIRTKINNLKDYHWDDEKTPKTDSNNNELFLDVLEGVETGLFNTALKVIKSDKNAFDDKRRDADILKLYHAALVLNATTFASSSDTDQAIENLKLVLKKNFTDSENYWVKATALHLMGKLSSSSLNTNKIGKHKRADLIFIISGIEPAKRLQAQIT